MLADQMVQRIEYLHQRFFLHRDIEPNNFLLGTGNKVHSVYLIDFGLAKKYMQKNGEHIQYKEGRTFKGTQRFSSINNHFEREQGRRDDLESLGYVLIYFLNGSLPWQRKQMWRTSTKDIKNSTTIETLCKELPKEFEYYMTYVRNLRFDEKPDYLHLRTLFKDLFIKSGFKMDQIYDWDQKCENPILQLPYTFQQQQSKTPQSTQI